MKSLDFSVIHYEQNVLVTKRGTFKRILSLIKFRFHKPIPRYVAYFL